MNYIDIQRFNQSGKIMNTTVFSYTYNEENIMAPIVDPIIEMPTETTPVQKPTV